VRAVLEEEEKKKKFICHEQKQYKTSLEIKHRIRELVFLCLFFRVIVKPCFVQEPLMLLKYGTINAKHTHTHTHTHTSLWLEIHGKRNSGWSRKLKSELKRSNDFQIISGLMKYENSF